jgi:pantoate--beta-alanine ligase
MVSIFVNPLQFGPNDDFAKYPRAVPADARALEAADVDLLFAPSVEEMYPAGFDTSIDPGIIGTRYEGALRPAHFRGVATVCLKLFAIAGAERAYFGAKDAQQVAVLQQMVRDLALAAPEIVVVPTVREDDGLALSSRNAYLTVAERAAAPALHRALRGMAGAVERGESNRDRIVAAGRAQIVAPLREAYLDVVDPVTFAAVHDLAAPAAPKDCIAIGSAWLGATRLIDNLPLDVAAALAHDALHASVAT